MAYVVSARPPGGGRTWTVVDGSYRTVAPVEEWLEALRQVWSPNTVRGYATGLAQWWTFLEQRDETSGWAELGVPAVSGRTSGQPGDLVTAGGDQDDSQCKGDGGQFRLSLHWPLPNAPT